MSRVMAFLLALLLVVAAPASIAAGTAGGATPPTILVFGDSISAGYGIRVEQGWVSLLSHRLMKEGYEFQLVNASVSGETTTGGLARLPRALSLQRPRIVILELGGNDGLRGLPLATTRENLSQMLDLMRAQNVRVLLLGMQLPPNYGARYTGEFRQIYTDLAAAKQVALVPFLLDKVALHPELMQADGIHPNEAGQPLLLENVWPQLLPLLQSARMHDKTSRGGSDK